MSLPKYIHPYTDFGDNLSLICIMTGLSPDEIKRLD